MDNNNNTIDFNVGIFSENMFKHARTICSVLNDENFEAYLVGGCVRDLLMGNTPKDIDIVTSAKPNEIQKLFSKTIPIGEAFGVIAVCIEDEIYEVATFRKEENYSNGRHPENVQLISSVYEDSLRRDFTINAIYLDINTFELKDFHNGVFDIKQNFIRCVGNSNDRIKEDYLRMLRAIRFSSQLEFNLDWELYNSIAFNYEKIVEISKERIREELNKILISKKLFIGLALLFDLHLFSKIFPTSLSMSEIRNKFLNIPFTEDFDLLLIWASILQYYSEKEINCFCREYKFSNYERNSIIWLSKYINEFKYLSSRSKKFMKRFLSNPLSKHIITYYKSFDKMYKTKHVEIFEKVVLTFQYQINPPPLITGSDLIDLGFAPGPRFSEILNWIRDLQLDEEICDKKSALKLAKKSFNRKSFPWPKPK